MTSAIFNTAEYTESKEEANERVQKDEQQLDGIEKTPNNVQSGSDLHSGAIV